MELLNNLTDYLTPSYPAFITLTGGGGKTTTLTSLGHFYKEKGFSVLITTTTKVQSPKNYAYNADHYFTSESEVLSHDVNKGELVFYAERSILDPKKVTSPRIEVLSLLSKRYDVIVAEADGARCLPLKLHTERDPVIPPFSTATLAIMGASAFGKKADNVCFGYEGDDLADKNFFQRLIDDKEGVLKRASKINAILINQCDELNEEELAGLRELHASCKIFFGSIKKNYLYV